VNSLLNLAIALNQGNYAAAHKVDSGPDWFIELSAYTPGAATEEFHFCTESDTYDAIFSALLADHHRAACLC